MKAATGELNLTVITIVAIAAIMAFFTALLWPRIKATISDQWDSISENSGEMGTTSQDWG